MCEYVELEFVDVIFDLPEISSMLLFVLIDDERWGASTMDVWSECQTQ